MVESQVVAYDAGDPVRPWRNLEHIEIETSHVWHHDHAPAALRPAETQETPSLNLF